MNVNLYEVQTSVKNKTTDFAMDIIFSLEAMPPGKFKSLGAVTDHVGRQQYHFQGLLIALEKAGDLDSVQLIQGGLKRHGLMSKAVENTLGRMVPKVEFAANDKPIGDICNSPQSKKLLNIVADVKEDNVVKQSANHPWRETTQKKVEDEAPTPPKPVTSSEAQRCFKLFLCLSQEQRNKVLNLVETYESLGTAAA